jgi:hypothetical protein
MIHPPTILYLDGLLLLLVSFSYPPVFFSSDTCKSAVPRGGDLIAIYLLAPSGKFRNTQNRDSASPGNLGSGFVIFYTILENAGLKNGQPVGRHRQLHGIRCAGWDSPC